MARWLLVLWCLVWVAADAQDYEQRNAETNRRWIVSRGIQDAARVGVFADYGVWHVGARALVEALEGAGVPCRVFDRTGMTGENLASFEGLILPGGFAPYQYSSAGLGGLEAVGSYVRSGGRCLAICAGAYLISREVRYDGISYPYPLGLFDGVADGPVAGLARYPQAGPARVEVTEEGKLRGLAAVDGKSFLYGSGPRFLGGTQVTVLARYHEGSAAVVERPVGAGEIVASGIHFERPVEGGDAAPAPAGTGELYRALLWLD